MPYLEVSRGQGGLPIVGVDDIGGKIQILA